MALLRPEAEKRRAAEVGPYREHQQALLEQAQRALLAFQENHENEDVFEALRANLNRLGWRVETDCDRRLIHQQWVERGVQVLQRVKELELRPEAAAGAWTETLHCPPSFGPLEPVEWRKLSPDVRAVERWEPALRLYQLALTGRVTEQEYRALIGQYWQ
jgi:hypothetical protein